MVQALGNCRDFVKFMAKASGVRALPQLCYKMERSVKQRFIDTKRRVLANGNLKLNVTLTQNHEQTQICNLYQ